MRVCSCTVAWVQNPLHLYLAGDRAEEDMEQEHPDARDRGVKFEDHVNLLKPRYFGAKFGRVYKLFFIYSANVY